MRRRVLLDTGPLVALLNRRDQYHTWAKTQWADIEPPFLTCEAVISEACFLLRNHRPGTEAVMELLTRQIVTIPFRLEGKLKPVAKLLARYWRVPMSLADACLVRIAEQVADSMVLTLDRDFRLYRKQGRQVIPTIMPDDL